jgi:hypothetical protein
MRRVACCLCMIVILFLASRLLAREPVLVQWAQCQDWVGYSVTNRCSFRQGTSTANAILVFALVSGTREIAITSVTDDHKPSSNRYVEDLHYLFGDVQSIHFYSSAGAGTTRSVTLNANESSHFQVVLMEVAGLAPAQPLKDRASVRDNGYNGGTKFTSGLSEKTTKAVEFLVGWNEQIYPNVMTFTDDPPWKLVEQEPIGGSRIAYRTTKEAGTFEYTGTFSGAGDYRVGAAIVTYKAADE